MLWVVQATANIQGVCKQVPTFFLDSNIQGITDEDTAKKVAKDVIDPFGQLDVRVFTEPALKQQETRPLRHILHRDTFCQPGMGVEDAYANGYKHGKQGVVTRGICALTKGTPEYTAWLEGYIDGELKDTE